MERSVRNQNDSYPRLPTVVLQNKWAIILIATLVIYGTLILLSPASLIYDEVYYISIAKEMSKLGLTPKFIAQMDAPTGILYAIVHGVASIFTNFQPPGIRYVNFALVCGSCYFLVEIFKRICDKSIDFLYRKAGLALAASWLATPITGVITCLALTEVSAIFFSLLGSLAIIDSVLKEENDRMPLGGLLLGGLAYGLSIWGRQNLVALPLLSLILFLPLTLNRFRSYLIVLFSSIPFFLAPVIIWGGLVPKAVDFVGKGILPSSFFVSLYYVSACLVLVCSNIYSKVSKMTIALSTAFSAFAIALFPSLLITPSQFFLRQTFGNLVAGIIGVAFSLVMLSFSLVTLSVLLNILLQNPRDKFTTFFMASSLMLLISNIKITHQFSSRYVTLALPYIFLAVFIRQPWLMRLNFAKIVALVISVLASSFFVLNYYRG
jgi:hypothetical protein